MEPVVRALDARADIATRVIVGRGDMATPIVVDAPDGQSLYGVETF